MKDKKTDAQPTQVNKKGQVTIDPKTGRQNYTEKQPTNPKGFWGSDPHNPPRATPDPKGHEADKDDESAFDFINKQQKK